LGGGGAFFLTAISFLSSCPADGPAGLEGAFRKKYRPATAFNKRETANRMSKDLFEALIFFLLSVNLRRN
jgi:hypothetical protein